MSSVTQVLQAIEAGDPRAADELLPLVYDELRKLAAQKLAQERPGQTLDATALVHEAYLRLVTPPQSPPSQGGARGPSPPCEGGAGGVQWDSRGHFFAAAAEAMRRILVDNARRRLAVKRGGDRRAHVDLDQLAGATCDQDVLDVHEALERLATEQPKVATLVKLRYFAGLTIPEAATVMGVAPRTIDAWWAYARAWLASALRE